MELKSIELPIISDARGRLMFAEHPKHVPFDIQRIFVIYDVAAGERRGEHAHRAQHQFLIMLSGQCKLSIDDGVERTVVELSSIAKGVHVPPLHWLELEAFSPDAMCLVLASDRYDESDYIRNLAEFRNLASKGLK